LQIFIPANASYLLNDVILVIANLTLIPTDDLYSVFGFTETLPYRENFMYAGYETSNMILNLGTMFLIIVLLVIWSLFVLILLKVLSEVSSKCKKFYEKKKESLLWNGVIRLCFELYLDTIVSAIVTIHYLVWDTLGDIFTNIMSFVLVGFVVFLAIWVLWVPVFMRLRYD